MPRLHHVDASFLAGECDPAIVARLDDVVRANAARKLSNVYVRSMGGVRTRPGMRLVQRIERPAAGDFGNATLTARTGSAAGNAARALVSVSTQDNVFIPAWTAAQSNIIEIDFGEILGPGTTVEITLRNPTGIPDGTVTRLD